MEDTPLLDTNILVYAFDKSEKKKHKISNKLLKRCFKGEKKFAVSVQNLSEFFEAVTKKHRKIVSKKDAKEIIKEMAMFYNLNIIKFDEKTVLSATEISEKYNMHYWDSLLAATMRENGISDICTENEKDFKVPWLRIINPFKRQK